MQSTINLFPGKQILFSHSSAGVVVAAMPLITVFSHVVSLLSIQSVPFSVNDQLVLAAQKPAFLWASVISWVMIAFLPFGLYLIIKTN